MCSLPQDVLDKLETTVCLLLDEERMFTAYDVTIVTRDREGLSLRHQDAAGVCHDFEALTDAIDFGRDMADGRTVRWRRTQRDVPGGSGKWAWVYHPENLDPNSYQFRNAGGPHARPRVVSPAAPLPPGTRVVQNVTQSIGQADDGDTSDSGGDLGDGTFATDCRNRLMIPTRFLKDAGINPGDTCFVVPDGTVNCVLVCKDTPAMQAGLRVTTQKVEKDGELRLSSRTLRAADLKDRKFVIETSDRDFAGTSVKVVSVSAAPAN